MLRLKLPSFGHLMQKVDSLEKTLRQGGIRGRRRRERQRMRWLDGITDLMDVDHPAFPAGCCKDTFKSDSESTLKGFAKVMGNQYTNFISEAPWEVP